MNMKRRTQKFTIVELLIVISILCILASLLMPAMNKAIERARCISCVNNMKQLGNSSAFYMQDFDDWVITTGWASNAHPERGYHWFYALSKFSGFSISSSFCPSRQNDYWTLKARNYNLEEFGHGNSYGQDTAQFAHYSHNLIGFGQDVSGTTWKSIKSGNVKNTAAILFSEGIQANRKYGTWRLHLPQYSATQMALWAYHNSGTGCNYLAFDGRVVTWQTSGGGEAGSQRLHNEKKNLFESLKK